MERVQEPDRQPVPGAELALDRVMARPAAAGIQVVRLRPSQPQTSWITWFLSPAVFLLAAGSTFLVFYLRAGSVTASTPRNGSPFDPRSASLELRVETQGPGLRLSWNRYSPAVQAAKSGLLAIDDGREHREFALDRNQIVNGSIVYKPASDDVAFRFELRDTQGTDVAQILRVLDASPRKPVEAQVAVNQSAPAPVLEANKTRHEEITDERRPNVPMAQAAADPVRQPIEEASLPPSSLSAKHTADPPASAPSLSAASASEPPADGETALTKTVQPSVSKPPTYSQPVAPLSANPQPNSQPASPIAAPALKPIETAAYVPPRPLKWMQPDERQLGSPNSTVPIDIRVKVKIDETGRVTSAHALIDGGKRDKKLMAAAAAAVRQWVFEPAKVRGTNVASEETIVIHLGPEAQ